MVRDQGASSVPGMRDPPQARGGGAGAQRAVAGGEHVPSLRCPARICVPHLRHPVRAEAVQGTRGATHTHGTGALGTLPGGGVCGMERAHAAGPTRTSMASDASAASGASARRTVPPHPCATRPGGGREVGAPRAAPATLVDTEASSGGDEARNCACGGMRRDANGRVPVEYQWATSHRNWNALMHALHGNTAVTLNYSPLSNIRPPPQPSIPWEVDPPPRGGGWSTTNLCAPSERGGVEGSPERRASCLG